MIVPKNNSILIKPVIKSLSNNGKRRLLILYVIPSSINHNF